MDGRQSTTWDVAVVGGAGHVGAPLAILLASRGLKTLVYDIDTRATAQLAAGTMPFFEEGGETLLRRVLSEGALGFSSDPASIAGTPIVILTIGTLIDEFSNPRVSDVTDCVDALMPHLRADQLLVLRSTVAPGVTDYLHRYLRERGHDMRVAFCPERVVQGHSIRELQALPQIISGTTPDAEEAAATLFSRIAPKIIRMTPGEAEYAKLFTNAWRYVQFAVTNQFYMMATSAGLDYARILSGMKEDYPRMRDMPGAGFAAGPCLYKDTLQLAASNQQQFGLAYAAIQINEGMPAFLVQQLASAVSLRESTVGLVGMAFKADSDDVRSSLSYKLKKLLRLSAREVLTTDPFVTSDDELLPLDEVVRRSDVMVLCAPHAQYREETFGGKPVLDMWNVLQRATPLGRAPEGR